MCFGYDGSKITVFGLNAVYIIPVGADSNEKNINAIEVTVFAREYIRRWAGDPLIATGPFFQYNGGVILFGLKDEMFKSVGAISSSFGLTFGWRIPVGNRFYAEPAFRIGYPYVSAVELTAGVRF